MGRTHGDAGIPSSNRRYMLKDLITNYKLTGIKYSEITNLLGHPDFKDSSSLTCDVVVDNGYDINPVYIKSLEFNFSKDSMIKSFNVKEWKK